MNTIPTPFWSKQRIVIIGDLIVDYYIKGKADRLCPEAPVPVVNVETTMIIPGGAANLACNIQGLGGVPILIGTIGNDTYGQELLRTLSGHGIEVTAIVDPDRPTTVKTRVMVQHHLVARIDRENRSFPSRAIQEQLLTAVEERMIEANASILSDYAKGVVHETICQKVIQISRERGIPALVDPKGANFTKYLGATAITPNVKEAEIATGTAITDEISLCLAGRSLIDQTECQAVLITRAEDGVSIFEKDGAIHHIPAQKGKICDVTGAGDTFIATLTLSLANGCSIQEAGVLANMAAGLVVQKSGTAVVTWHELNDAWKSRGSDGLGPL